MKTHVHVGCGSIVNPHNYATVTYFCRPCDRTVEHVAEVQGRSLRPTSYAVSCQRHGYVFMTLEYFTEQTEDPTAEGYSCPMCLAAELADAGEAEFDEDNFQNREAL